MCINHAFCKENNTNPRDGAERCVNAYLHWFVQHKPDNFANGRDMRYLFKSAYANQADRLAEKADVADEEPTGITKKDLHVWVCHPQERERWGA